MRSDADNDALAETLAVLAGVVIAAVVVLLAVEVLAPLLAGVIAGVIVGLAVAQRLAVRGGLIVVLLAGAVLAAGLALGAGRAIPQTAHELHAKTSAQLVHQRHVAHRQARRAHVRYQAPSRSWSVIEPQRWQWHALTDHAGGLAILALPVALVVIGGLAILAGRAAQRQRPAPAYRGPGLEA